MKSCIIIGGGSSVKEGIDLGLWDKIKDQDVWSVNYAFITMPFLPKREIWVDIYFFKNNMDILQKLSSKGVPCYAKLHHKYANIPEIKTYVTTRELDHATDKIFIGRMGLSGFFALSLAIKENYERIFLLGYDFGSQTSFTHYYQHTHEVNSTGVNHPELYRNQRNEVKDEVRDFEVFLQAKAKIYNVSLESRISCFEKINYDNFFTLIQNEPRN